MSVLGPLARFAALACLLVLLAAPPFGAATPLQPDIEALLREAEAAPADFAPARAGWNGPEQAQNVVAVDPLLAQSTLTPEAYRAGLATLALPNWRVWLALLSIIMLMRALRMIRQQPAPANVAVMPRRDLEDAGQRAA